MDVENRKTRAAAILVVGMAISSLPSALVAQDASETPGPASDAIRESTSETAPEPAANEERMSRETMIPRDALVDMARAQSGVICSSEVFLGCMGFDGRECLTLSESAIDRCLMPLPPEIDPTTLDSATLEACPREIYARAGHEEEKARSCFERALEGS